MTPMAEFLRQMPRLRLRAFEHTRDTNAAYMLVHNLMTRAVGRGVGAQDPDLALTQAIAALKGRPPCTQAAA